MGTMEVAQHVYIVKVRNLPDPALLFPSERRYSALTVAGLACGHALLGAVALLLGALAISWDPPAPAPAPPSAGAWTGHLGAGLWLGLAALQAAACGLLAWRRWYEDRYIVWFFRSSLLAALIAAAGLVLTSAALAHLHENVLGQQTVLWHSTSDDTTERDSASGSQWLDLSDSNSSTISSGGVFADSEQHEEDLLAAESTQRELPLRRPGLADGESSLLWSPLPIFPHTSAQIRSLVGVNVLVASLLELLWSLLGARVAWRGMRTEPAPPQPRAERGAADGKVDLTEKLEAEPKHGKRGAMQQQQQQRRRAPDLPEHRTMNLEDRMARFLERGKDLPEGAPEPEPRCTV